MAVKTGDTVKVHYKGTFDDGVTFDNSEGRTPLEFTVGTGRVIPGFERNVIGMEEGQKKKFKLGPTEAYGERRPDLVQSIPRDKFPPNMELKEGMILTLKKGEVQIPATIRAVEGETVKLDFNHPLAGKNLNFEIELVGVT